MKCGFLLAGTSIFKMNPPKGSTWVDVVTAIESLRGFDLYNEEKKK